MINITHTATQEDAQSKIKSILKQKLKISAAVLTKLKQTPEGILLNGKSVFATQTVNEGDVITITIISDLGAVFVILTNFFHSLILYATIKRIAAIVGIGISPA